MKFKNHPIARLFLSVFSSLTVFIGYIIEFFLSGSTKYWGQCLAILLCIWVLYGIATFFSCSIIVTETSITVKRFKKIKWCIEKSEIEKIEYINWVWWAMPLIADTAARVWITPKKKQNKNAFSKMQ